MLAVSGPFQHQIITLEPTKAVPESYARAQSRQHQPAGRSTIPNRQYFTKVDAMQMSASASTLEQQLASSLSPTRLDLYHHGGKVIDGFGNQVRPFPTAIAKVGLAPQLTKIRLRGALGAGAGVPVWGEGEPGRALLQCKRGGSSLGTRPGLKPLTAGAGLIRARMSKIYKQVDLTGVQEKLKRDREEREAEAAARERAEKARERAALFGLAAPLRELLAEKITGMVDGELKRQGEQVPKSEAK